MYFQLFQISMFRCKMDNPAGMDLRIICSLLMHILLLLFAQSFPVHGGNETDRQSLLAFKAKLITGNPLASLSSWNESTHFCHWPGVTCGRRHQRVTMLDLQSQKLVGTLSPYIGNLSFLRILNLQNNGFNHDIPQELGRLFRLQILTLENNSFGGEIPTNISRCTNLVALDLYGNNLSGKLPTELGSLSILRVLLLTGNNLIGEIPPSFGNLSLLQKIYLPLNNLQGSIPNTLGQLKKLERFSIGSNKLSGTIPPSIFNLSSLTLFSVIDNQLHGSFPPNLCLTLPKLNELNIGGNQFTGLIPNTISNASSLVDIYIGRNNFTGKVPTLASQHHLWFLGISMNNLGNGEDDDLNFLSSLRNCTDLEVLGLAYNNFGGVMPEFISNFSTKIRFMALGGNQIRGNIPSGIGNIVSLEVLAMETNQLIGTIPSSVVKLQKLYTLALHGNKLSGSIPSSLGNLTSISGIILGSNNLQGRIPSSLGDCRNLLWMDLSQNNLSGTIPKEVLSISSLSVRLILAENHLTGSLPREVGKLGNLGYLDVSENKLSGEIPSSLGSCTSLESLYLEGNFFQGTIPPSLNSLRGLQNLDLSRNNLSGQIPKYLEGFALQNLNLSFNDFEGDVPIQGVFKNASAISITGNRKLCGGIPQLNLPTCPSNEPKKQRLSFKVKLLITLASGLLGLSLMLSFLILYRSRLRKTRKVPPRSSSQEINSLPRVSYEDLLNATNGFASANLIGVGSFGSVYKGILPMEETVVAVKVLNLQQKGAYKSFMAECEALRNIRHRNLVKVLTACSSVDFQGNDFKALIYEFMVNGSLEDWLHPIHREEEAQEQRHLNLLQRIDIAIGVANALDYLHHHCEVPIVHCDLKPSNILMDNDMIACIADFGLAKFYGEANQTSSLGIKGSIGYAAPEYGIGNEVSTYGDVYSYGILLLEMFTGKRPTDGMLRDGLNLHNFVMMAMPEKVVEIADPILLQRNNVEEEITQTTHNMMQVRNDKIEECLISFVRIGLACSAESPGGRMDISNVAAELHLIKDSLMGIGV